MKEHHYTLYYYDRAGQLTKTVPPEGVELLSQTDIDIIKAKRAVVGAAGSWTNNAHRMQTKYQYNSFGQLIAQQTPDGGTTKFIYDSKNRLRFSQNEKQLNASTPVYSYTKYDELGRITEVGESSSLGSLSFATTTLAANIAIADNTVYPSTGNKQITTTVYSSVTPVTYYGKPQRFIQNRVSYSFIDEDPATPGNEHYTYYSYDSHGNVEWMVQDQPGGIGKNYVGYEYDLVSGKVLKVSYNEGRLDRFYHRYEYDAENRLVKTLTSRNGELWDNDGSYAYYPHGPLKRQVIGEDHVQGLDYIYTIHGWIKSINSPSLTTAQDPGEDNSTFLSPPNNNPQEKVAADRHGMVLNYYNGDYTRTGNFLSSAYNYNLGTYSVTEAPSLYNGNISSWVQSQLNTISTMPVVPRSDLFKYDLLNRIKESTSLESNTLAASSWSAINTSTATYKTLYDYDANGNILTATRKNDAAAVLDNLTYKYITTTNSYSKNTNKLGAVDDAVSAQTAGDLYGTQSFDNTGNEANNNYVYDNIGNLIKDVKEGITNINWTSYGKITNINKTSGSTNTTIDFDYDAFGNRVKKSTTTVNGSTTTNITHYYEYDSKRNVIAIYEQDNSTGSPATNPITLKQQYVYGSVRIGVLDRNIIINGNPINVNDFEREMGYKSFELRNHLENVLTTISDRKIPVDDGTYNSSGVLTGGPNNQTDYFNPEVLTATDYYAFGAPMPNRQFNSGNAKFGFNGKENDNDVKGIAGSQQDYGMRIYDPRVGKFLSMDPISKQFPELTPFQFASNRPIDSGDLDGLERTAESILSQRDMERYFNPELSPLNSLEAWTLINYINDLEHNNMLKSFNEARSRSGPQENGFSITKMNGERYYSTLNGQSNTYGDGITTVYNKKSSSDGRGLDTDEDAIDYTKTYLFTDYHTHNHEKGYVGREFDEFFSDTDLNTFWLQANDSYESTNPDERRAPINNGFIAIVEGYGCRYGLVIVNKELAAESLESAIMGITNPMNEEVFRKRAVLTIEELNNAVENVLKNYIKNNNLGGVKLYKTKNGKKDFEEIK